MNLPFSIASGLYVKAMEKYQDEKLWEMWLSVYPQMDKDSFVSFEQFKLNARKQKHTKRSEEEIIKDSNNILKSMKKRGA
ncbi:hypothetical protein [Planomicrobium soli]|uniref:hypothetical protein n=1 Tax=Planomicrobium soli TaxID=1176648 RepID=UPI000D0D5544|nr:hypothetical protein [Planomicrobium soli]